MMLKMIKDYFLVLLGTLIMAAAVKFFILPFNVLSGGVAGIAVALEPVFHLDPDLVINGLVLGMFVLGSVCLGKEFAVKTFLSSLVYPIYLAVLDPFVPALELEPILASIYGGALAGIGIGLVMRTGSSTGGMDIPPLILKKYMNIEISKSVMVVDALTVLLGLTTYGLEAVLIGLFSVVTGSYCIDKMLLLGSQDCKSVQIISDQYELMMEKIHCEMDRGSTLMDAQGGYTGEKRKVLLVVIENKEYNHLIRMINEIDPKAFVITTDIKSVHGEGFALDFKI
ncbi:MAG: YitT family protein [Erysipelotrichaceae bacterium]|nr:YitT family protein [Erysipelotrichaceae bacterium]